MRYYCCVAICLIAVSAQAAEIQRWVDKDGNVHFSDAPPEGVVSTPVEVDPPRPNPTDVGEQRRRALLEQAETDSDQRAAARAAQRNAELTQDQARALDADRCFDARVQLAVLDQAMPVYRTSDGRYRPKWTYDAYTGARIYLDDAARAAAIGTIEGVIGRTCVDPRDAAEQVRAGDYLVTSEYCTAERVRLEMAERPEARTSEQELRDLRQHLTDKCP